jgi:hypothetical protein
VVSELRRRRRSGDLVRALTANRDAKAVEGILHLRYIPGLDYVQVNVNVDGRLVPVDPASVDVVRRRAVPIGRLEADDPTVSVDGWRRVDDLDDAIVEGLVQLVARDGLTWDDLWERLRRVRQPLLDAGWQVLDEDHEEGRDECVFGALGRDGQYLVIEHFPDGWTRYWPADENFLSDEDTEPIEFAPDLSTDELRTRYQDLGWL